MGNSITEALNKCRKRGQSGEMITDRTLDYWNSLVWAALYALKRGNVQDAIRALGAVVREEEEVS